MAGLNIEILTPFGKIYTDEIKSCIIPGMLGQFQVLKDHASLLAAVDIGMITIEEKSGKKIALATSGGYCEVDNNNVKLIVESAEKADKISIERAKNAKTRAEERLCSRQTGMDMDRAKVALARALNRLKIAGLKI